MKERYAHSLKGHPPEKWHALENHLSAVANNAAGFARAFGGENWAYLAGLWHDLGKFSDAFQTKLYRENGHEGHLETKPGKVVHSEAGGHLASLKKWRGADRVLSWLIMGHHAGLTDFSCDEIGGRALEPKMRNPEISEEILAKVPKAIADQPMPKQPIPHSADPALFIRMLFSCLVDADFLDTENFMDKKRGEIRHIQYPKLARLLACFDAYMENLCGNAEPKEINRIRAKVLEQCRRKAIQPPSVFSLTVPTGGGKTLSSLAFGLTHAVAHGKDRIIYVIPYTSIIEQTADVFRNISGLEDAVVEHHSNIAETSEDAETVRSRLAAENWDAPIVVTTSVQFLESLYACRTSRCRKLHNIVNSVVIFDEAQCLPPKFLRPAVHAIRELYRHYRVTPVLCTATQPVLTKTESFDFNFREGFDEVEEIVENPEELALDLKRVETVLLNDQFEPVELPDLAESIKKEEQSVLCIVNRREDARQLARLLPSECTYHLSTNMCATHRSDTLAEVKKRLLQTESHIYVVSTSLVEAGVDIDFPVVYRALAGIDSIAQAAGRCNREGKLAGLGKTVIFIPPVQPVYVRQPADISRELLQQEDQGELLSPKQYDKYFRRRFWQLGQEALDGKGILELLGGRGLNYYFRTAAERFQLIEEDWQESVIAPYGEAVDLLARLVKETWQQRSILRSLGRYAIGIPKYLYNRLAPQDFIRESGYPGIFLLDYTLYDDRYGFVPPDEANGMDPEKFFV